MTTDIRAECDPGKQTAVNRALFRELGLTVISIGSAPRAGRTTILERMLPFLEDEFKVAVLETDLHPALDVRRIRRGRRARLAHRHWNSHGLEGNKGCRSAGATIPTRTRLACRSNPAALLAVGLPVGLRLSR